MANGEGLYLLARYPHGSCQKASCSLATSIRGSDSGRAQLTAMTRSGEHCSRCPTSGQCVPGGIRTPSGGDFKSPAFANFATGTGASLFGAGVPS